MSSLTFFTQSGTLSSNSGEYYSTRDDWNGTVTETTKPLRTDPTTPITSTRPRTTSHPVTSSVSPKTGHKHAPVDAVFWGATSMTLQFKDTPGWLAKPGS